ncbi:MAG TPA: zinc ribbon domain-containing protein [Blastocatellia bacterium]|nr:zinc ribbon domain-containing protein [Blastocatellia bacterium]
MFCPNCGSQNADGTKFCRTCGANLSLVPQALTGQLTDDRETRRERKRRRSDGPPNLAHGINKAFAGLGFLFAAMCIGLFFPGGRFWWFWMLIPAFGAIGKGVSEIVSAKMALKQMQGKPPTTADMPPRRVTGELPPEPPGFTLPPPSVTEHTTRHLDPNKDRYPQSR